MMNDAKADIFGGALALGEVRHIQDPLHGTIALTALECRVVDHPIFQRLRSIKQLGNASLVFPSATHTRFSHSLGVMHQAGRLFSALVRNALAHAHPKPKLSERQLITAVQRIHQRIRLAGLLHDLGHGPFSHHFEHFLQSAGTSYGEYASSELKIPLRWVEKSSRNNFVTRQLCHEHFSFGLIKNLGFEDAEARALISLLDHSVSCGPNYETDLKTLAAYLADGKDAHQNSQQSWRSLHACFKSLLSSDIDADRIDYLQRDAYFCGVSVSIDVEHLLRSIELVKTGKNFVIELKPNAIFAVEQLLLARKQMFDQVYQNRAGQLLDELLTCALEEARKVGVLKIPQTVAEFLKLTDESMLLMLRQLVTDTLISSSPARTGDLAIKMYLSRCLPVTLDTKLTSAAHCAKDRIALQRAFPNGRLVALAQQELMKCESRNGMERKTQGRLGTTQKDVLFTRISRSAGLIPLRQASELLKSSAWREKQFRIIVTETLYSSAIKRGLTEKLKIWGFFPEKQAKPRRKEGASNKKKQA